MSYAQIQRMRFIDFLLFHYGEINRAALADYFGLSIVQVSKDFADYQHLAPANMKYNAAVKKYVRGKTFSRIYP